jgi:hypothetical protein
MTTAPAYDNSVRIGYARVSTRAQERQAQLDALAAAHCREIITETATTRGDRPRLSEALSQLQAGDTLVIYKPDRVARSMKELLVLLEDQLHARGINLHILTGICAVPCLLAEGRRGGPQVRPGCQDPAAVTEVVADPDTCDVVWVVVDFPEALPGVHPGVLASVGVKCLAVVGAVADLDAVGVDRPPGRRQQLDVVTGGQRDRDVTCCLHQGGIHLVRGQLSAGHQRVAQSGVWPVLPGRDEPFVQEVLKFHDRPCRPGLGLLPAPLDAGPDVARPGDVLPAGRPGCRGKAHLRVGPHPAVRSQGARRPIRHGHRGEAG